MGDYMEDAHQHRINGIGYRDDMDQPLLIDKNYANSPVCQVAQQGFHQSSIDQQNNSAKRKLFMAISLCFLFMIAEIIGGYMAGSLAIMADAAHLLSDCISFIVALLAIWMSRKQPDHRMTFGYKRVEVMGAIISIFGIWLLTAFLCYFSVNRLIENDFDIDASTMMLISGIGILINIVMAFILHGSCSMPHTHSHSHAAVPAKSSYQRFPSNKLLQRVQADDMHELDGHNNNTDLLQQHPTFIINGSTVPVRSDSVCSYRSPSHSRTNSFSKSIDNVRGPLRSNSFSRSIAASEGRPITVSVRLDETAEDQDDNSGLPENQPSRHHHHHHHHHRRRRSDSAESSCATNSTTEMESHDHQSHSHSHGGKENINIQAAVIHVIGDFIQSVGVFLAAIVINYYPSAKIVDPLCTFLFSIIVVFTTVRLMRKSLAVVLDAAPDGLDVQRLSTVLNCLPGVLSVHHLTVWSVTVDWNVMAVHLMIDSLTNSTKVLENATDIAREDFGIKHCTIQLERINEPPQLTDILHSHHHTLDIADSMINFV